MLLENDKIKQRFSAAFLIGGDSDATDSTVTVTDHSIIICPGH